MGSHSGKTIEIYALLPVRDQKIEARAVSQTGEGALSWTIIDDICIFEKSNGSMHLGVYMQLLVAIIMKKITLLILSMTIYVQGQTQDVFGTWYGISENHLTELVIKDDSIKMQIVKSADDTKGNERGSIKHLGVVRIKDKPITLIPDNRSTDGTRYQVMTVIDIKNGVSMELASNGVSKSARTVEELINLSANDTTKLFGNIFFHRGYLKILEKLKGPDEMSIDEFKLFLRTYVSKRERNLYKEQLMVATFQDQIINSTLIEMAFSPINRGDWLNNFLEKYLTDKDVEELWRKM